AQIDSSTRARRPIPTPIPTTVTKGDLLSFSLLGIGVLCVGISLAGLMWAIPHVRRRRAVRRFAKALRQLELVVLIWAQSIDPAQPPSDDIPVRRVERRRHN